MDAKTGEIRKIIVGLKDIIKISKIDEENMLLKHSCIFYEYKTFLYLFPL